MHTVRRPFIIKIQQLPACLHVLLIYRQQQQKKCISEFRTQNTRIDNVNKPSSASINIILNLFCTHEIRWRDHQQQQQQQTVKCSFILEPHTVSCECVCVTG